MEVQFGPTTGNMVDPSAGINAANAANAHYGNHYHDLHHHHQNFNHLSSQPASIQQNAYYGYSSPTPNMRKRKAESQDNQHVSKRLSKRLALLNLGKNGQKLYVPVESASPQPLPEHPGYNNPIQCSSSPTASTLDDDVMQLDNTKHKVYIYDLDAELSSADENSESESPTSGRKGMILFSDMKKHLRQIPPAVFANSSGELAGHNINDMQMVLYSEPSSLTVPREQDSVRKAILEARARARQKLKDSEGGKEPETQQPSMAIPAVPSPSTGLPNFSHFNSANTAANVLGGYSPCQNTTPWNSTLAVDEDVDAMDTD